MRGNYEIQKKEELLTEIANGQRVVSANSEHQLSLREESLDLVEFGFVVESGHLDVVLGSIVDMGSRLAGMSKDDTFRRHTQTHHLRNLGLAGTIEARSQSGQSLQDAQVIVALYRYNRGKLFLRSE